MPKYILKLDDGAILILCMKHAIVLYTADYNLEPVESRGVCQICSGEYNLKVSNNRDNE